MKDELEAMDRATLRVWRFFNVMGWWLAGVVVVFVTEWAGGSLVVRLGLEPDVFANTLPIRGLLIHAGFATMAGFAAGGLIGAKVWRNQRMVAFFALFFISGLPGLLAFVGSSPGPDRIVNLTALIPMTVGTPWAALVAKRSLVRY